LANFEHLLRDALAFLGIDAVHAPAI
jgi:hypothetical protein